MEVEGKLLLFALPEKKNKKFKNTPSGGHGPPGPCRHPPTKTQQLSDVVLT